MRVIAGSAKGIPLRVPKRVTRPSTDRLREALFSILGPRVVDADVLDLFAGSGALGIEALSRGAARCTFVEENAGACGVIHENLRKARLSEGVVLTAGVPKSLGRLRSPFDLILADPPYARTAAIDHAGDLMESPSLPELLAKDGLLILEVEAERDPPGGEAWELLQRRDYGGSTILFYAPREGQ